jgi:predicted MFS family arabinose efflux permease
MSATVIIRPNRRAVGEAQTGLSTVEKPHVSAVPLGLDGCSGLGYVFALLLFVIGSDLYVVAPLLPGIQNTLHCTVSQAGLVVTAFTAGYALASPLIGGLADRLGRLVVLYAGTATFIIFEAISAWAPSYPILIVGRAMTGIAAAAITPTAYTIIGDTIAYQARGRVMSIASVRFSVSTIAGVPLGLWLSNYWSWRGVLWALTAATVVAASTLLIPLRVVNLQEWEPRAGSSSVGARLREALNDVRGLAPTWPVTVVSFLAFAVIGLVYTYLVVDLRHRFGWSNGSVIGLLFLYGLANVAGDLALGRLGDRSGKERAVRVGQMAELAALIVLALALWQDARIMLVAALCVFAFGQAYIPNLKALASAVAPELRGRSLAWNNAAMYGGMMVGSWGASVGYQTFGLRGLALAGSVVLALAWLAAGAISEAGAEDA